MTIQQLRREVRKRVDQLDEHGPRSAADFLAFLQESSNPTALAMAGRLRTAEERVRRGQVTGVAKLKRKY